MVLAHTPADARPGGDVCPWPRHGLESSYSVGGAHAGGGIVALLRGSQIVTAAVAVRAEGDVVEIRSMAVQLAGAEGSAVAGQADHRGDQGGGGAGATYLQPAGRQAEGVAGGVVDGQAGAGIGDGGDVGDRAHGAVRVVLVRGLAHVGRAAAARAAPVGSLNASTTAMVWPE